MFSQVAVGIPVVVLFESSLLLARWAERKRQREAEEAEAEPARDPEDARLEAGHRNGAPVHNILCYGASTV